MWGANDVLDLGEGKSALGPASSFSQHQRPALALAMRPMASACSLCRICIHCDCVQRGGPGLQQSGQSQGTRIRESRAASGACIRPLLRLLSALFTRLTIAVQSRRSCQWSRGAVVTPPHRPSSIAVAIVSSPTTGLAACALHCPLTGRRTSGNDTVHRPCRPPQPQQRASVR